MHRRVQAQARDGLHRRRAQANDKTFLLLWTHDAPDEARATGERASYPINVLPVQGITYAVQWSAKGGLAQPFLDGRPLGTPSADGKFQGGDPQAEPGVHTLELEGAPMATLTTLTLLLSATGCPPSGP